MNSDRKVTLFRKFGYLRVRCLLEKQDELGQLEEELGQLDKNDPRAFNLSTRRRDKNLERRLLLAKIGTALEAYGDNYSRTIFSAMF
jgi:hypothetical protein